MCALAKFFLFCYSDIFFFFFQSVSQCKPPNLSHTHTHTHSAAHTQRNNLGGICFKKQEEGHFLKVVSMYVKENLKICKWCIWKKCSPKPPLVFLVKEEKNMMPRPMFFCVEGFSGAWSMSNINTACTCWCHALFSVRLFLMPIDIFAKHLHFAAPQKVCVTAERLFWLPQWSHCAVWGC